MAAIDRRTGPQPAGQPPTWTVLVKLALLGVLLAWDEGATKGARAPRRRSDRGEGDSGGDGKGDGLRGPAIKDAPSGAENETDRGRQADKPTDIPAKGWKDILWRVVERFSQERIMLIAAGVTFYALLALFPAIAAFVSLYGLFADPNSVNQHLQSLSGILPGGAVDIIGDQVKRIASKGGGALGFAFFSGLAVSLWSANAGMKALFDALNISYGEEEKRGFVSLTLQTLACTLGALVFIAVALGAIVVLPVLFKLLPFGAVVEWLLAILRWPILFAVVAVALAALYRYGPSRDKPQWRWLTWGSAIAAALWLVGSMLFSWYVSKFGSYNETYGSLGAAVGFLTWVWISTIIVMVGAEINAEMEHQTAKDTTEGSPQPIGTRDARMADTVGEAKA